jgi:hypothetical protein
MARQRLTLKEIDAMSREEIGAYIEACERELEAEAEV